MFAVDPPLVDRVPMREPVYASCTPLDLLATIPVSVSEESRSTIRGRVDLPLSPMREEPATLDSLFDASHLSRHHHLSEALGRRD